MKPLLILGWKTMPTDVLVGLGVKAAVVLGDEDRAKHGELHVDQADLVHVKDITDVTRLVGALARAGLGPGDFTAVYTDREQAVVTAALMAHYLGCAGLPVRAALAARDKWLQKQAVAAAGLTVARHTLLPADPADRAEVLRRFTYPAFVKPTASSRSRYISYVRGVDEALDAVAKPVPADAVDVEAFLLEGEIDAPEIHLDGVVRDGAVEFLSLSDYGINVLAARDRAEISSTIVDPDAEPARYAEATDLTAQAMRGMGVRNCVFHLEAFVTSAGLVFSECAVRTAGGYVVDAVQAKFGVDLRRAGLELVLGRPVHRDPQPRPQAFGWTYLASPPGRISGLPTSADIRARPGVVKAEVERLDGNLAGQIEKTRRMGLAVVQGDSRAQLAARIADLDCWFRGAVRIRR